MLWADTKIHGVLTGVRGSREKWVILIMGNHAYLKDYTIL